MLRMVLADTDRHDQKSVAMLPRGGFVILDTTVTLELAAESLARDVVRAVQQARRDAGLEVSDRISLQLAGDEVPRAAVEAHAELIKKETRHEPRLHRRPRQPDDGSCRQPPADRLDPPRDLSVAILNSSCNEVRSPALFRCGVALRRHSGLARRLPGGRASELGMIHSTFSYALVRVDKQVVG
jgi:hypothetical protein